MNEVLTKVGQSLGLKKKPVSKPSAPAPSVEVRKDTGTPAQEAMLPKPLPKRPAIGWKEGVKVVVIGLRDDQHRLKHQLPKDDTILVAPKKLAKTLIEHKGKIGAVVILPHNVGGLEVYDRVQAAGLAAKAIIATDSRRFVAECNEKKLVVTPESHFPDLVRVMVSKH